MILETVIILSVIILILFLIFMIIVKNKIITEKIKLTKLKVLVSFGKYDDAKKLALKIVDKYPQNYVVHKILGQLYKKEGNININIPNNIQNNQLNHMTIIYNIDKKKRFY